MAESNIIDGSSAGFWANRRAMVAILLVSMCPFQYGLDFGLIGGIQAMLGFLQVGTSYPMIRLTADLLPLDFRI